MHFQFDFTKTVQASAVVLRSHGKRMSYLRLLKLLYIADRELLAKMGRTITGDRAMAMKNGPVLSTVYNLIKQKSAQAHQWDTYIHKTGYQIHLRVDPGIGQLSKGEIEKLEELCDRYRNTDDWTLSEEITHEFAEWKSAFDPTRPQSASPILWEDAIAAQGRAHVIPAIARDVNAQHALTAIFGG